MRFVQNDAISLTVHRKKNPKRCHFEPALYIFFFPDAQKAREKGFSFPSLRHLFHPLPPPPTCLKTRTHTPTCSVIMMKKREGSYALQVASGRLYIDRLKPPYPAP